MTPSEEFANLKNALIASSVALLYVAVDIGAGASIILLIATFAARYATIAFAIMISKNDRQLNRITNVVDTLHLFALYVASLLLSLEVKKKYPESSIQSLLEEVWGEIFSGFHNIFFSGSESLAFLVPLYL